MVHEDHHSKLTVSGSAQHFQQNEWRFIAIHGSIFVVFTTCVFLLACADLRFNPLKRSRTYVRARFQNWVPLAITYCIMYMGRYNFILINQPRIRDILQMSETDFGLVISIGFWSYGILAVALGPAIDMFGGQRSVVLGAAGSGLVNVLVGLLFAFGDSFSRSTNMAILSVGSVCNYFFQTMGSSGMAATNGFWYSVAERGIFMGIYGFVINFGYYASLEIGAVELVLLPWPSLFVVPGMGLIAMSIWVAMFVYNKPSECPALKNEFASKTMDDLGGSKEANHNINFWQSLKIMARSPSCIATFLSILMTGFMRDGIVSWFGNYLRRMHGVIPGSLLFTATSVGITLGAGLGGMLCGTLSNLLFGSRRFPAIAVCFGAQMVLMASWRIIPQTAASACFFVVSVSFFLFGIHNTLKTAALDVGDKAGTATVYGLLYLFQYTGGGTSGVLIGYMVTKTGDFYGWLDVNVTMTALGLLFATFATFAHFEESVSPDESECYGGAARSAHKMKELSKEEAEPACEMQPIDWHTTKLGLSSMERGLGVDGSAALINSETSSNETSTESG